MNSHKHPTLVSAVLLILLNAAVARAAGAHYTKGMFIAGVDSGGFVLITLRDPGTHSDRRVCTLGTFLVGALHLEYNIAYNGEQEQPRNIAIRDWHRPFLFNNRKAFKNVEPRYTPAQLEEMRQKIAHLGGAPLEAQLRSRLSPLHQLYNTKHGTVRYAYRDAIAHILLTKGILVAVEHGTGMLQTPY